MPINRDTQEVLNVYLGVGTRDRIRPMLRGDESVSAFVRVAVQREIRRRERAAQARWRRAQQQQQREEVAS